MSPPIPSSLASSFNTARLCSGYKVAIDKHTLNAITRDQPHRGSRARKVAVSPRCAKTLIIAGNSSPRPTGSSYKTNCCANSPAPISADARATCQRASYREPGLLICLATSSACASAFCACSVCPACTNANATAPYARERSSAILNPLRCSQRLLERFLRLFYLPRLRQRQRHRTIRPRTTEGILNPLRCMPTPARLAHPAGISPIPTSLSQGLPIASSCSNDSHLSRLCAWESEAVSPPQLAPSRQRDAAGDSRATSRVCDSGTALRTLRAVFAHAAIPMPAAAATAYAI
jgi:hypothetical protein